MRRHGRTASKTLSDNSDAHMTAQSGEGTENPSIPANEASSYSDPSTLPGHQSNSPHISHRNRPTSRLDPAHMLTPRTLLSAPTFSDELSASSAFLGAHNLRVEKVGIVQAAGHVEKNKLYNFYLFSLGMCPPHFLLGSSSSETTGLPAMIVFELFYRWYTGRARASEASASLGSHVSSVIYIRAFFFLKLCSGFVLVSPLKLDVN